MGKKKGLGCRDALSAKMEKVKKID